MVNVNGTSQYAPTNLPQQAAVNSVSTLVDGLSGWQWRAQVHGDSGSVWAEPWSRAGGRIQGR